ncbi:MAG: hypothetical protein IRZ06_13020 [Nevskia sp.]|nr:hypothetical protein [Nevskia sp.]
MESKHRASELLTIQELVDLLAPRVRKAGDTLRQAKDKVRKRLLYAQKSGELERLGTPAKQPNGRFKLSAVIGWARFKWPGKVNDLLAYYSRDLSETLTVSDSAIADIIPGDLPRCQQALRDSQNKVRLLEAQLAESLAEIRRLKPLADRYEANRAKNRESAKKPRKGNW